MIRSLLLVCACALAPAAAAGDTPFLLGGIQVNEPDHARWVEALKASGMNTVETTVYAHQGDWDRDHLWWNDEEPAVVAEIRAAKAAGLRVVLVLRVALDHAFERNAFLWHGQILPATDAALDSWFAQYRRFVLKWARIAQREGVDVFAVGSEMKALVATVPLGRVAMTKRYHGFRFYQKFLRKRARRFAGELSERHYVTRGYPGYPTLEAFLDARFAANTEWAERAWLRRGSGTLRRVNERRARQLAHWHALIAATREVYDGAVTYAANFDHYDQVAFWDALDFVGINSYFPLREHLDDDPGEAALLERFSASWRAIFDGIERFKRAQRLAATPVLFTELGYTFRRHSTVEPWNHEGFTVIGWKSHRRRLVVWREQPVDREERALALRALLAVHHERPGALGGLLYWKLSSDAGHESVEPFVLHVGAASKDPAIPVLRRFSSPPGRLGVYSGNPR